MQVKIFVKRFQSYDYPETEKEMDKEINGWLMVQTNIQIHKIKQSFNEGYALISVWYTEMQSKNNFPFDQ